LSCPIHHHLLCYISVPSERTSSSNPLSSSEVFIRFFLPPFSTVAFCLIGLVGLDAFTGLVGLITVSTGEAALMGEAGLTGLAGLTGEAALTGEGALIGEGALTGLALGTLAGEAGVSFTGLGGFTGDAALTGLAGLTGLAILTGDAGFSISTDQVKNFKSSHVSVLLATAYNPPKATL
jgi:hypothetical protein